MADGRGTPSQPAAPAALQLSVPEPRRNGHSPVDVPPPEPPVVPLPRRPLWSLLAVLLAGVLLGGGAGALLSGFSAAGSSATALVQLASTPDPGLAAVAPSSQSEAGLEDFTATELAWLSGDGLAADVAARLRITDPDEVPEIGVTRVGQAPVVEIAATGETDAEALLLVRTAVNIYTERRRDGFRANVDASLASVDRTLQEIGGVPPPELRDGTPDPRLERLLTLRSDLLLLANRNESGVQVLEPAVLARPGTPPWIMGTVLGAAVGGLLAVGGLSLHRSRRRTLAGSAEATAITDRVLHPEVELPGDWRTRTLQVLRERDRYTAQLLVAQIARRRTMGGQVVAVVGASPRSASRAVATMIAVGLARQTPTVLAEIGATGAAHPLVPHDAAAGPVPVGRRTPTQMDGLEVLRLERAPHTEDDEAWTRLLDMARTGERCLVLDLGAAPELLRLLPATSEPILVLGAGVDDVAHSTAIAAAVRVGTAPLLGVVTRQGWRARRRGRTAARLDG